MGPDNKSRSKYLIFFNIGLRQIIAGEAQTSSASPWRRGCADHFTTETKLMQTFFDQ